MSWKPFFSKHKFWKLLQLDHLGKIQFWWMPDSLSLASALLIVLAFPPFNFWPLIWIALVPWFFALDRADSLKRTMSQGVWLSVFMTLAGFHWVAHSISEHGSLPYEAGLVGLFLFSFFCQPQFYFFAWIRWTRIRPHLTVGKASSAPFRLVVLGVLSALLYVGIDWVCPKIFMDTLGHSLWMAKHLRQVADLGGPASLSFLIFLVNDAIYFWFRGPGFRRAAQQKVIFALAVSSVFWIYGYFRSEQINRMIHEAHDGVQVAAIQANIGDFEKVAAERGLAGAAYQVLDSYSSLTRETMRLDPKPQLVVWPETSYPSTFGKPHSEIETRLEGLVQGLVQEIQVPLLFGGYDTAQGKDFNSFFFLSPLERLQTYHKNILLIFGEYIPGADSFELIRKAFPQVANFGRGRGPEVVSISYSDRNGQNQVLRIAPIICYEALFTDFVLGSARQGSQVIFNITNDGWFGDWGEPQLHLALTVFRSIETRLPLFRSTNTGISALILPSGEIINPTAMGARTVMNAWIPLLPAIPTVLKYWGDWFGPTGLLLGIFGILVLRQFFDSFSMGHQPIGPYGRKAAGRKLAQK
jgi:apolipoprotein N-acyltransferase